MNCFFTLDNTRFVADQEKMRNNRIKHEGVNFEQAAQAFFDPCAVFFDASRRNQYREAFIGHDQLDRLLYVVFLEGPDGCIRLISARKATPREKRDYHMG